MKQVVGSALVLTKDNIDFLIAIQSFYLSCYCQGDVETGRRWRFEKTVFI